MVFHVFKRSSKEMLCLIGFDKTVRRRSHDQVRPKQAPKGPKMTPKRDRRPSPKRPKIDIKIDIDFDAKTKGAGPALSCRHWAGNPPPDAREAPQGAAKRVIKANPNRKTKLGPNQRAKWRHPLGIIWDPKTAPKPIPKRSKIETKIQDEQNTV